MESTTSKGRYEKMTLGSSVNRMNHWFDQFLSPNNSLLPQTQTSKQQSQPVLKSRWFRLLVVVYIVFSVLLTAAHFSSWLFIKGSSAFRSLDTWTYQRTYDPEEPYSLISNMSHGLKMSKLFSKGHYDSLKYVQPYWQKASEVPHPDDVTFITTTTPTSWKELVHLAENWQGPISTTLHISKLDKTQLRNIQAEYKSIPALYNHVDVHLVETPNGIEKTASILVPLNVERNLARIYARSNHVSDMPIQTVIATNLRETLLKHRTQYTELMTRGDMLVLPMFKYRNDIVGQLELPQTKKEVVGLVENEKVLGLYDVHFEMNQGPTEFETWKKANDLYPVTQYTMEYEPIVIESKTVQSWCSERFVDKKSACLLSSYLAGNNFMVLPNDFAVQKPSNQKTAISDLDTVIEKRLYAKFYWEQCVYHGRQLDAMGLWNSAKSNHIREQCSRVIQNWGRGLIGKPE